jgi:hypothetical protein
MFFEKNNGQNAGQKVLVAPLDWGLGHATRCIPIIYRLINNGATVFVAADGAVKALLEKELPQVVFIPLPGYKIQYSRRAAWLPLKLLLQFPGLLLSVYQEHKWLKKVCKTHGFSAVISDNRLGLYHKSIRSVYITHQLTIKTGNRFTEWVAQKIHYRFINKYHECWVPDNETDAALAGELSHPEKMPAVPVIYIGPLSRFEKKETEKKYEIMVLLSGPEPQRTIFENIVCGQLQAFQKKILFVRGLPESDTVLTCENSSIEIHNHLNAESLSKAIQQSGMVVCRSGYTTIMDLVILQQTAVLVPTPGQTEQEYLAAYLGGKNLFYSVEQNNFSLNEAIEKSRSLSCVSFTADNTLYKEVIDRFIKSLQQ